MSWHKKTQQRRQPARYPPYEAEENPPKPSEMNLLRHPLFPRMVNEVHPQQYRQPYRKRILAGGTRPILAEEKVCISAPEANPPLKGDKIKESSDLLEKQTTSSSKSLSYSPSSLPSSRQPDKSISCWDPAYVEPEGPLSRDKKGNKKKTSRK
ncbi:hypothetical protein GX50_07031 [[Emmonsia] crescens]|uniref:Uncharacterized protein n=1 Tax=[Emmonsia] crescens TaxID=73230 RepID=A0A2B7Z1H3_9EURO|nr:hypothetical protein GX50_07031 [Emmonsia crescens]